MGWGDDAVRGVPENDVNVVFSAERKSSRTIYVAWAEYVRIYSSSGVTEEKWNVESFVAKVPPKYEVQVNQGHGVYFRPDWAKNYHG